MLSETEVITIGLLAVPRASILPPLAIMSVDASAPVPDIALITVPASIVSVAPSVTETLPLSVQIFPAVRVLFSVMFPSIT